MGVTLFGILFDLIFYCISFFMPEEVAKVYFETLLLCLSSCQPEVMEDFPRRVLLMVTMILY